MTWQEVMATRRGGRRAHNAAFLLPSMRTLRGMTSATPRNVCHFSLALDGSLAARCGRHIRQKPPSALSRGCLELPGSVRPRRPLPAPQAPPGSTCHSRSQQCWGDMTPSSSFPCPGGKEARISTYTIWEASSGFFFNSM